MEKRYSVNTVDDFVTISTVVTISTKDRSRLRNRYPSLVERTLQRLSCNLFRSSGVIIIIEQFWTSLMIPPQHMLVTAVSKGRYKLRHGLLLPHRHLPTNLYHGGGHEHD